MPVTESPKMVMRFECCMNNRKVQLNFRSDKKLLYTKVIAYITSYTQKRKKFKIYDNITSQVRKMCRDGITL